MKSYITIILLATAVCMSAAAQDESCEQRQSDLKALKEQSKQYRHEYEEAFGKWDNYYRELHSRTYEGTGKPLADSAKECINGDVHGEDFCKGTVKAYDELSAREQEAKTQLDAAKKKFEEARVKLIQSEKSPSNACPAE